MIILTPELAAKRIQARRVFPNATWLPGDEPPIGMKVRRADGAIAEVRGVFTGPDLYVRYWWLLRDERYDRDVFDWPPTLRMAE